MIKPQELIQALQKRYATKQFNPNKSVSNELIDCLTESLVLTPSSFGLQPWKFLVIEDQTIKEKLLEHSWNQPQVTECSHLIVLAAQSPVTDQHIDQLLDSTVQARGGSLEDLAQYRGMMSGFVSAMSDGDKKQWAKQQVYIALGQLLTSASLLGIDACPMEGIVPEKYDEVLGLTNTEYFTTLACPIGYRSDQDKYATLAKVRYGKHDIIEYL